MIVVSNFNDEIPIRPNPYGVELIASMYSGGGLASADKIGLETMDFKILKAKIS